VNNSPFASGGVFMKSKAKRKSHIELLNEKVAESRLYGKRLLMESFNDETMAFNKEVVRRRRLGFTWGAILGFTAVFVFVVAIGLPLAMLIYMCKGVLWTIERMLN
jgi:hypothetical protein